MHSTIISESVWHRLNGPRQYGRFKKGVVMTIKKRKPDDGKNINPYRSGSDYNLIWSILYSHRKTGIRKQDVIKKAKRLIKDKTDKQIGYSLAVVSNVSEDGLKVHRSAKTASLVYWVERIGDSLLKLHIR